MKTKIENTWLYDQSVEEIWEYLTNADLIAKWLMPNNFEPIVGKEFQFNTNPIPSLGLSGNFYCKVLELVPLKKLVYSWKGGLSEKEITLDTIVEWTIEAKENGTELSLVQTGFKEENHSIWTSMFDGWKKHVQKMQEQLKKDSDGGTKS